MIKESSLGQFINFFIFVVSLILLLNNIFDFRFQVNFYHNLVDNLGILEDFILIISSILAMYFSISSPYEYEDLTQTKNKVGAYNSYVDVIMFVALVYNSSSTILEDTDILYTFTTDTIYKGLNAFSNVTGLDGQEFIFQDVFNVIDNDLDITALGALFVQLVNYSKIGSFLGSFYYLVILILNDPPDLSPSTWKRFFRSLPGRAIILAVLTFNVYVYANTLTTSERETKRTSFIHLKEITRIRGIEDLGNFWLDETTVYIFKDVTVGLLIVSALYIIAFYGKYKMALLPTLLVTLHNLIRADEEGYNDNEFTTLFVMGYIMLTSIIVFTISYFIKDGSGYSPLYTATNIVPNILYKLGHLLSIVSVCLLFVAYQYDWIDFEFQPGNLAKSAADQITNAEDVMEDYYDQILNMATTLDPCVIKIPEIDTDNIMSIDDIPERIADARGEARKGEYNMAKCTEENYPYEIDRPFPIGNVIKCNKFANALEKEEKRLRDEYTDVENKNAELGMSPITEDDLEDEFYVSESCQDTQCAVLTALVILGMAIAWIPFVGGIGPIISNTGRAVHNIFRIGRKLSKFLPRMKRIRRSVVKLAKRIRKLAVITKGGMSYSNTLAVVFLPVIVSAAVSLTLIMFRRKVVKVDGEKITRTERVQQGLSLAISLTLPIILFEGVFLLVTYFYPELVQLIMDQLPETFVQGEMEVMVGYRALQYSYLASFIGNVMVLLSNLAFSFENGIFGILDILKGWTMNFFKSIRERRKKRKEEAKTSANPSRKNLKSIIKRIKKIAKNLLNWKVKFLQPFLFSLPVIYLAWLAHNDPSIKYVNVYYSAKPEAASAQEEIGSTIRQEESSTTLSFDISDNTCGPVGLVVKGLLEITGGIDFINELFETFGGNIATAIESAKEFIGQLNSLVEVPRFEIDMKLFDSELVENIVVFFIPLLCTTVLGLIWVISLFFQQVYFLNPFTRVDHNPTTDEMLSKAGVFILAGSLINISVNMLVGSLILVVVNSDLPYIQIQSELGDKHYITLLCSIFNMISGVAVYVNTVAPPQE